MIDVRYKLRTSCFRIYQSNPILGFVVVGHYLAVVNQLRWHSQQPFPKSYLQNWTLLIRLLDITARKASICMYNHNCCHLHAGYTTLEKGEESCGTMQFLEAIHTRNFVLFYYSLLSNWRRRCSMGKSCRDLRRQQSCITSSSIRTW